MIFLLHWNNRIRLEDAVLVGLQYFSGCLQEWLIGITITLKIVNPVNRSNQNQQQKIQVQKLVTL